MFKQQLQPRTVHPYQTTVVSRSEQQFTTAAKQRAKYPWVENSNASAYQIPGTDSSMSDHAYNMPHYYNDSIREYGPPSPVYQSPYGTSTWCNYKKGEKVTTHTAPSQLYTFPQCASAFSLPICDETHAPTIRHSPIPAVPSVSPEVPIIGACGGHCPGFEYVCYYILQVIFVVGILTGISLCIAGIVLRRTNRNGDLGVLVYIEQSSVRDVLDLVEANEKLIMCGDLNGWVGTKRVGYETTLGPFGDKRVNDAGCLSSCVCCVLLGVQCCVRREIRQRKLRANLHIPMHSIQEPPAPACPLLTSTLPHSQLYRPTISLSPEEEVTGVPWWRRANGD